MQPVIRWTDRIPLISGDAHNLSRGGTGPFVSKRVDLRVDGHGDICQTLERLSYCFELTYARDLHLLE